MNGIKDVSAMMLFSYGVGKWDGTLKQLCLHVAQHPVQNRQRTRGITKLDMNKAVLAVKACVMWLSSNRVMCHISNLLSASI